MSKEIEPRPVRVMADYECYPLWLSGENENVPPEDSRLGLTADLAGRLREWAAEFDGILCRDDPASSAFPSPEAEDAFVRTGEALSRQMAKELGPGWKVSYFDQRISVDRDIPYA